MINRRPTFHSKFTNRNIDYMNQYFELVNDYYSTWSVNDVNVSYYNLDIENSNVDKTKLNGGAYQTVGNLSGWRWRKILNFDLGGVSTVNTTPTNDERGTTNIEKLLDAYFPRTQGIVPKVHDFIAFDEFNTNNNYILNDPPLYEVVNVEKSNDFELGFYKINCKITYILKSQVDCQLTDIIDFLDYEKKLYTLDASIVLNKILDEKQKTDLPKGFDQKIGLYCETMKLGD